MSVPVGVLDIGSNTTRLLVATVERGVVVPIDKEKLRLSLGEEIERYGVVSDVHVAAVAKGVRRMAKRARSHGVQDLDVFLTAPGRQSGNAGELVAALTRAAGVPVRVLSKEEEGRLAYAGAVAAMRKSLPRTVAVCDVGGASTEIAVGSPNADPRWIESVDLGSVRLTTRASDVDDAIAIARKAFAHVEPPPVEAALTVGGSARAARRLVGPELDEDALAHALRLVEEESPRAISRHYGVDRQRARILLGGIVVLAEVQRLLGVPLVVCDGGIREGAVLASAAAVAA